jgi:hypothetical protein
VKALFDAFRPPHNVRIHLRSLVRTPFRTVSLETVWKIAGGFLIACVSCCKRARWDVFVLFWLLAILQIEAYWDFPDSL